MGETETQKTTREVMNPTEVDDGNQSQVEVGRFRGQKCVIKRILHPRVPLLRTLEQWILEREARALETLEDLEQVPDFLGCPDSHSIALEFRRGRNLREIDPEGLSASFFRELEETVHRIHRRGIVHSDLKRKENILVSPSGRPVILDFGASFRRKSWFHWMNNFCYGQFKQIDRNAVSKLKARYCPEIMDQKDHQRLQHPVLFEQLSRFANKYILFRA